MSSYETMLENRLKESGDAVMEPVIGDGQFHLTSKSYYLLCPDKPVVAIYGKLDGSKPKKMIFATKNAHVKDERDQKVKAMKKQLKAALSAARTMIDEKEPDSVPVLLAGTGRANEIAIDSDAAVIELLSAMTAFEYDRVRTGVANRLNIRGSTLDKVVAKAQKLQAKARSDLRKPRQLVMQY